jgi:hypothetical protein
MGKIKSAHRAQTAVILAHDIPLALAERAKRSMLRQMFARDIRPDLMEHIILMERMRERLRYAIVWEKIMNEINMRKSKNTIHHTPSPSSSSLIASDPMVMFGVLLLTSWIMGGVLVFKGSHLLIQKSIKAIDGAIHDLGRMYDALHKPSNRRQKRDKFHRRHVKKMQRHQSQMNFRKVKNHHRAMIKTYR